MLKQRFIIYGLVFCLLIVVSYKLLSTSSEKPAEAKNNGMEDAIRQLERFNGFATPRLNRWNDRDPFELSPEKPDRPSPPGPGARSQEHKADSLDQAGLPKPEGKDYQLIAILSLDGEWSAYVRVGDQGFSVKQGDSVEGEFEVLSVGPTGVMIKEKRNNRVTRIELSEESK